VYFMRFHKSIKQTYDREQDTFRYLFLIGPCALLAVLTTHDYSPMEVRRRGSSAWGRGTPAAAGGARARVAAQAGRRLHGRDAGLAWQPPPLVAAPTLLEPPPLPCAGIVDIQHLLGSRGDPAAAGPAAAHQQH